MRAVRLASALILTVLPALAVTGCSSIPADPENTDPDMRRRAAEDLAGADDDASIALLRRLLADTHTDCPSHPHVRGAAARSLGLSCRTDVVPDLAAVLQGDPSVQVRVDAAWGLGRMEIPEAVPPLRAALERATEKPEVRRAATRALGMLGDPAAVPDLVRALTDKEKTVRFAARDALVEITGEDKGDDPAAWK
jgi:HEAT repeat protein